MGIRTQCSTLTISNIGIELISRTRWRSIPSRCACGASSSAWETRRCHDFRRPAGPIARVDAAGCLRLRRIRAGDTRHDERSAVGPNVILAAEARGQKRGLSSSPGGRPLPSWSVRRCSAVPITRECARRVPRAARRRNVEESAPKKSANFTAGRALRQNRSAPANSQRTADLCARRPKRNCLRH